MSWGVRLRMLVRFLGLTAVLAAVGGALFLTSVLSDWSEETLAQALQNKLGQSALIGAALMCGGALLTLFAILVEVLSSLTGGSSRRGAAGANSAFQVVIASALLVAVNAYAFLHDVSFDLTRDRQFTLPANVVSELRKLKSETTIVVLQQHKTFGRLSAKPDRFDYAAERKLVEKIKDLAEQFRKVGSQFKVAVLDVEEEGFEKKLNDLTRTNAKLKEAINAAPENSIFFVSENKVQRMSFNEFYQLDKLGSKTANGGKGNLVLNPQGIENLLKRITAIEEKRPKIAVAVTHPYLSTQARPGRFAEPYILAGFRKSLEEYGFDVVDVVIKKNYRGELDGDPAAYTVEETQLMELEARLAGAKEVLVSERRQGEELVRLRAKMDEVKDKSLGAQMDAYLDVYSALRGVRVVAGPQEREDSAIVDGLGKKLREALDSLWKQHQLDLADAEEAMAAREKEWRSISKNERALEDRYMTDYKVKMSRLLADCDMLFIPRLTILNATKIGMGVLPKDLHKLDEGQIEIIKDFMKSGKPALVCAGPINQPDDLTESKKPDFFLRSDSLEALLRDRGVQLSRRTILFNVESQSFRDMSREDEGELKDSTVPVPPLVFTPPQELKESGLKLNPIAAAMEALARSIDQPLDIEVRAPRPITLSDAQEKAQGFHGDFIWTSPKSWDETFPFNYSFGMSFNQFTMRPERQMKQLSRPRLDTASAVDKKSSSQEPERRGPFSIAVSLDGRLPESWYADKEKDLERKSGRLAVIGHGGIFNGSELSPATEKLALVVCNWLLKRDDRLPHVASASATYAVDRQWSYPRIEMTDGKKNLWHWGTFFGLPALFVYLGVVVLMVRKVR